MLGRPQVSVQEPLRAIEFESTTYVRKETKQIKNRKTTERSFASRAKEFFLQRDSKGILEKYRIWRSVPNIRIIKGL